MENLVCIFCFVIYKVKVKLLRCEWNWNEDVHWKFPFLVRGRFAQDCSLFLINTIPLEADRRMMEII